MSLATVNASSTSRTSAARGGMRALLSDTALAFALRLVGAALLFAAQFLLARLLGVTQFGEVVLLLSWLNVAVLIAKAGFDGSTLRWSAVCAERHDADAWRRFARVRWICTMTISLLLMAGIAGFVVIAGAGWSDSLRHGALVMLPIVPLAAWHEHYIAQLRGQHKNAQAELAMWTIRPLVWIALCTLWLPLGLSLDTTTVLAAYALATLVAVVAATMRANISSGHCEQPIYGNELKPLALLRASASISIASGCALALTQSDVLILGGLVDAEAAGVYSVASRLAVLVSLGLTAINGVGAARIAACAAGDDALALRRLIERIALLGALYAIPTALVCWFFCGYILQAFGEQFTVATAPFGWLLLGQVANALCGPVGCVAMVSGREGMLARVLGITAIFNIALQVICIRWWGLTGAAVATCLSTLAWNVMLAIWLRRELGFDLTLLGIVQRLWTIGPRRVAT